MSEELASNWGRWGDDDQLGAVNLLTPDRVLGATGAARKGEVVSLGRVIRHDIVKVVDRPAPTFVLTVDGGDYAAGARSTGAAYLADDFLAMPLATGTHLDGLAHAWSADGLYNGHDPNQVRSRGAKVCGIENVKGIVTRGVLADICKLHGVESLPASHEITVDELVEATEGQGSPVQAGDALLIRTGWLSPANIAQTDPRALETTEPGIGIPGARWIAEQDIAIVGADNLGVEVFPVENPEDGVPVHLALINRLGVHMIELMDLEELAAKADGAFMFVVAPLRLRGAVNSPINPLAVL